MDEMLREERKLWLQGYQFICGIDEAGRGSLVSAVVAAAVILPQGLSIAGVNDSKKLTPRQRDFYYDEIMAKAVGVGIGVVDHKIIDQINIKQAARLAMKKAVGKLPFPPDYLLVDAEKVDIAIPQKAIIKGDSLSQSIAAASIIAKVTRDRMCLEWDAQFPQYGIKQHKGYPTKAHLEAIMNWGPCSLHRKTFLKNLEKVSS